MGMSAELRNSCQYQGTKIDDAIPTSTNKPDEFIFCFNRQGVLLLSIQCGNFISWVDIILVAAGYCGPQKKKKKKKWIQLIEFQL